MIKFESVSIEGFGSILDMEFEFKSGLNIIKADNGVGKTTIFNAWYWCLTGDTLKPKCSINTWDRLRPNDYQGTKVSVLFSRGEDRYEVIRCQDYRGKILGGKGNNRLVVIENGNPHSIKTKAETQKYLLDVLGYSPDLLKNTLIFGQKLKRLIDESGTNKKEILEEAFEVSFINNAQDRIKKRKQNKLSEYSPLMLDLENKKAKLQGKREALALSLEHEAERNIDLSKRIQKIKERIKELEREKDLKASMNTKEDLKILKRRIFKYEKNIKKLQDQKELYYQLSGEIGTLTAKSSSIRRSVNNLKHELEELKSSKKASKKKCNWCGQNLKGKSKETSAERFKIEISNYKDRINIGKEELELIKGQIQAKNRQLTSLKEVIDQYNIALNNKKELENEASVISQELKSIEQYDENIKSTKEELKALSETEYKKKSTKIKRQIRKLKKEIKPLQKDVKIRRKELDILEWLINDPLSNSGLKAFIFNDMIHTLNERMAHYSQPFGFRVEFDVDMDSARKDINAYVFKEDEIISYYDLSGGQAQFIAVVMAFGLHDIVAKETKATNILLMDEIFESLSIDNVEKVMELIRSKLGNISINLITHRNEFNPYNSRIIRLKSEGEITQAINL